MTRRSFFTLAIVLCLALAAAAGAVALSTRPTPVAMAPPAAGEGEFRSALADYEARLLQIDRALQQEREQRSALAVELAELRTRLASGDAGATVERARTDAGTTNVSVGFAAKELDDRQRPRGLDVEALVAAGFSADKVRAFKEKMDQIELDRLYLRDLAAREGWLDTERFRQEDVDPSIAVRQAREELGDEFYDWMLYTTGHPNRVRVGEVLAGSAAATAGLLPGDLVLSYDEQRVFSPGELRDATSTGTADSATAVSVQRDGREMQVFVPRGPLGIRIDYATEEPPPAG